MQAKSMLTEEAVEQHAGDYQRNRHISSVTLRGECENGKEHPRNWCRDQ
jgi:hypothetical protein